MNRMLSTALALATLAGVSAPAHADEYLQCEGFTQTVGYAGHNPPVSAIVSVHSGTWSVVYVLANGQRVDRSDQYTMTNSNDTSETRWTGRSFKKPNISMTGAVMRNNQTHHLGYLETAYDNNTRISENVIDCGPEPDAAPAPAPAPAYAPPAPAPAGVGRAPTTAQLTSTDDHLSEHVMVNLGSQSVDMLIDTGASLGSVTVSMAATLIASGEANWNADGYSILADGSRMAEKRVNVHHVTIGGRSIDNVLLSVVPNDNTVMLLGMQVLRTFGRFTIDTVNDRLILG